MMVKIALAQMSMGPDKSGNVRKAVSMIKDAAEKGASVVCLPELFTSPYFPQEAKADAEKYAEEVPGPTAEALSAAARENGVVVVGGSVFEREGKTFYNTTAVFDETGKFLGKYQKMHIPHDPGFYEQNYFERGALGYRVFDTKFGKLGTLICYDQWFPEAARTLALMGADIIFYPTAIGTVAGIEQAEGDWQAAWEAVQRGHAIANATAVCAVNRVGSEGKTKFWGGSFISTQFGTILARGGDSEGLVIADIDTSLGKKVREGWRFFYNRRPETYGKLVER
ncbi:MAG: nitrilase-related carbon-nitrogen hydrolase [Candidatus Micrarchaeota archaeon]